jgi:phosphoglycerate dehydrogenase-like enzyme
MPQSDPTSQGASVGPREINLFATDFPFDADDRARLAGALGDGRFIAVRSRADLAAALSEHPETDVICPLFTLHGLPDHLPYVRWLALSSAGADGVIGQPQTSGPNPPIITTASGVHAAPISEHVFSAMLQWSRKWRDLARLQADHIWPDTIFEKAVVIGGELYGATLLVIGFGSIGRRVAQLGRAFGMRVIAVRRGPASGAADVDADHLASITDLDALLPEADYVAVATPSTEDTRGMISAARLALMKPSAMLINVARGDIVDEPALIAALTSGAVGAAALDVAAREPLPKDDPLWSAPNIFLSPHVSGVTMRYSERLTDILLDNIGRYREGRPMRNLVNLERGY